MAKEQPFRSIEMRGRQSSVRSDLQAADHTQKLAEYNRRQLQKQKDSHEALNNERRFRNFNSQVLEETAIQQQRLEMANLSTNAELAAKAKEIIGRRELEGERMRIQQEDQIRRMKNSQEIIRNQLQQQLQVQEANTISEFGNQLLSFSETLYRQKADQINEANKRLQAQGQLDYITGNLGEGSQDLSDAQTARVALGMSLDTAAAQLDAEGKPTDATNIRAHNGHYQYGIQEGMAIKHGTELKGYLQQAKEDAIANKLLNFGDPSADAKLQVFLQTKTIDFMVERGLTSLPIEIQQKYLAKTLITAQASVMAEFNEANQKYTLDASIGLVRNQIRTGSKSPAFAEDLPNMLSQLFTKDPENFSANLTKVYSDLKADTYETGDMTALDTLITTIEADQRLTAFGQDVINDYLKYEETFDKAQAKAADDKAKELADRLLAGFNEEATTIDDVTTLTERRQFYFDQAENLPLIQRSRVRTELNKFNASDLESVKNANDAFLATPGATPENLRERALDPRQPQSEKDRLIRAANSIEKLAESNPQYKTTLRRQKGSIETLRPTVPNEQLKLDPQIRVQIDEAVKRRKEELDIRFQAWVTDGVGEKNADTMKEWFDKQTDLLKDPIVLSDDGKVEELRVTEDEFSYGAEDAVKFTPQPIGNTQRNGVFFTGKESRSAARRGALGRLDSTTGVFLNPPEIVAFVEKYEKTGLIDPLVRDLAIQAGVTPKEFMQNQADLWGMPGEIQPYDTQIKVSPVTQRVSRDQAFNFALDEGLGRGGAIMFANSMMEESTGNPLAEHDPDPNGKPTGFGLFGHRLTRKDALEAFAAEKGKSPSDPTVQMQYAISELRAYKNDPYYGHVYEAVFAENPTMGQLVEAQRDWLRFHSSLHGKRENSLVNDLLKY